MHENQLINSFFIGKLTTSLFTGEGAKIVTACKMSSNKIPIPKINTIEFITTQGHGGVDPSTSTQNT